MVYHICMRLAGKIAECTVQQLSVSSLVCHQITLRTVSYPHIWNHLLNSSVTHYCGAPTVQVCSIDFLRQEKRRIARQIGLVNAPEARPLPQPAITVVAGSAPTAHLIGELEKKGIRPVHVYGLTYVNSSLCSFMTLRS